MIRSRFFSGIFTSHRNQSTMKKTMYGPIPMLSNEELKHLYATKRGQEDSSTDKWYIYTDGSVISPSTSEKKSIKSCGFAYFVHGRAIKHSQWIEDAIDPCSGYAEIRAAAEALYRVATSEAYAGESVVVRTDFSGIIEDLTIRSSPEKLQARLKLRRMRKFKSEDTAFHELFHALLLLAEGFPNGVLFEHVYAHNGQPHNAEVDRMAYEAAWLNPLLQSFSYKPRVDFLRKDRKKEFGEKIMVNWKPITGL